LSMLDKTYQEVLAATRQYMAGYEGSYLESYARAYAIAKALGWTGLDWPGDKFEGQVTRALNTLIAEGAVIKVGKGQRHPSGAYESGAAYYSPAKFEAAVKHAESTRRDLAALTARWEQVHDELAAHGIPGASERGGPPVLSIESWERVAGYLASGVRQI
jgi:hypothetical protein